MFDIVNVGAVAGGECYLLTGDEKTALIDSGFAFCAETVVKNLENHLKGRPLDYILLTHSHYDHVSGTPYVKARWPEALVVSSAHAAKALQRPTAKRILKEMNEHVAQSFGVSSFPPAPVELAVDLVVNEGDLLDFGNMTLEVLETPGHTRCAIAFYSKEADLLLANETFGTLGDGVEDVIPCHLVGHQATLDSIKKAASKEAEHVLIPHYGLVHGKDAKDYFEASSRNVERTKELLVEGYEKGLDLDGLIQLLKDTYYNDTLASYQPEPAFLLNASYMIPMILREVLGVDVS